MPSEPPASGVLFFSVSRLSSTLLSDDLAQVLHFATDSCGESKTDFQILGKVEFSRPFSCLSVRHACVTQTDNAHDSISN